MRMLTPFWTTRSLSSDLWREMDRMLEDFVNTNSSAYDEREFAPASEIIEEDNHFMLSIDLPGIKRDDLNIEVSENILTISGERKRENHAGNSKGQHIERSFGTFKRSFILPNTVDGERIEANYQDGVLELYLPKTQAAKPKKIEIQSGKGGFFDKLLGTRKNNQEMKDVTNTKAS